MLNRDELKHIAKLACIAVDEEELIRLSDDINTILGYVRQLERVETDNVEPLGALYTTENVFREDKAEQTLTKEEIFSNSPAIQDNYFKVPLIIERK